jgi:hypothetical protein
VRTPACCVGIVPKSQTARVSLKAARFDGGAPPRGLLPLSRVALAGVRGDGAIDFDVLGLAGRVGVAVLVGDADVVELSREGTRGGTRGSRAATVLPLAIDFCVLGMAGPTGVAVLIGDADVLEFGRKGTRGGTRGSRAVTAASRREGVVATTNPS